MIQKRIIILSYFILLTFTSCSTCLNCIIGVCTNCSPPPPTVSYIQQNCICLIANCANCSINLADCFKCEAGYNLDPNSSSCILIQNSSVNWTTIGIIIAVVIVGIIIVWIFIIQLRKIYRLSQAIIHPQTHLSDLSEVQTIQNTSQRQLKYIEYPQHDGLCKICFKQNIDIVTNCQHFYHYQCLVNRYWRNCRCVSCPNSITSIRFLCKECRKFTKRINICKKGCKGATHLKCVEKAMKNCKNCEKKNLIVTTL